MIEPLVDFEGSFATMRQAFGVDDDRGWTLAFRVFLARAGDATVLVDTGLGPPGDDPFMPERDGRLPELLDPAEVDLVVFTHLHPDHVGWNMRDGRPVFPNARYVAHAADYEHFTQTRGDRPYVRTQIAAAPLELVEDGATPIPGVTLHHAPGHTPGHCVVELPGALVLGDLAVHELQLADPGLAYVGEEDPELAADARRRILPSLGEREVAVAHLGVGRILADGEGFRWVASK